MTHLWQDKYVHISFFNSTFYILLLCTLFLFLDLFLPQVWVTLSSLSFTLLHNDRAEHQEYYPFNNQGQKLLRFA